MQTFRNNLRSELGDDTIQALTDTNDLATRMSRSTDVQALRNYSRVGGVLIGLDPRAGGTVHFRDLLWSQSGDSVALAVIRAADGKSIPLGAYKSDLINEALAYAMDGRPATVTILYSELIDRYQVLLHPALRDTSLGARIGRADEWIFEVLDPDTQPNNEVRNTLERMYAESKLYERALTVLKSGKGERSDAAFANLKKMASAGDVGLFAQARSFDQDLLGVSLDCAGRSENESQFDRCVTQNSSATALKTRLKTTEAPRVGFVSQIFEEPYDLDPDLKFLNDGAEASPIWPLDFTVQMTVNDKEHVTFPQFKEAQKNDSIAAVVGGIRGFGEIPILDDLKNFTILQRLFRESLIGQMGRNFR